MVNAKHNLLLGLSLAVALVSAGGAVASAAPPTSSGISLTPFEQQLVIQPGDTTKEFDVVLTNHTGSLQELDLTTQDFGSLNDSGGILLIGATGNDYSHRYGLASWLTLGTDTVVLQPGETRTIPVTVTNRDSLQPGGHYGAVVATVNSFNSKPDNRVAINQQLLSLVFVDKTGGEHFDLKLAGLSHNGNWVHLPSTVKLHFLNPGNVHVIPRGTVKLIGPGDTVLAKGIINDDSSFVLPETYRDIYVTLTSTGKHISLPGTYHLQVDYRYDGLDRYATKDYLVHYIDLKLFAIFVVLVAIAWWFYRRHKPARKSKS